MGRRSGISNVILLGALGGGGFVLYQMLTARGNAADAASIPVPVTGQGNVALAPVASDAAPAPGRSASDPRGIRNNNPGNIKYNPANQWQGQVGSDGTFCKFDTMENGLRAMFVLLRNYCQLYNLCTIAQIASRWAPAGANNPATYGQSVSNFSGIPLNQMLQWGDISQMVRLAKGIVGIENGAAWINAISEATYQSAFNRSR